MRGYSRAVIAAAVLLGPAALSPAQDNERARAVVGCDSCHDQPSEWTGRAFVHAPVELEDCGSCHNPHASRHGSLLRRQTSRTCLSCHEDLAERMARESAHGALTEERECLACHDPHASDRSKLLTDETAALCMKCHELSMEGSHSRPHAPFVAGECLACHDPHSSSSPGLPVAKQPDLCTACHSLPDPGLEAAHGGIAIGDAKCSSCHAPHGSEREGLIRAGVHAPFAEGCETCHGDSSVAPADLRRDALDLCTMCHDPHSDGHPVPEDGACLNCHDPHASPGEALIAGRERVVCLECHSEVAMQQQLAEEFHSSSIQSADCTTCHELHVAHGPRLLKGAHPHRTCTECHASHAEFSHPMGPGVADPTNEDRFLSCLSCHESHGSPFRSFLSADPRRDLCVRCHQGDSQHATGSTGASR